ncbi:hypothetical protein ACOTC5_30220 [Achromobacter xylosoxidans]
MKPLARAIVVYCAGGMKSDWVDRLTKQLSGKGFILVDPRQHGSREEAEYTRWDLTGVEISDVVLGYMEASNPGGSGLAVEFGWGAKADKHLILLEEEGYAQQRYFGMVRAMSNTLQTVTAETMIEHAERLLLAYSATRMHNNFLY